MNRSLLEKSARTPGTRAVWALVLGLVPLTAAFIPRAYVATVGEARLSRRVVAGAGPDTPWVEAQAAGLARAPTRATTSDVLALINYLVACGLLPEAPLL
jgi:hypothetical protein